MSPNIVLQVSDHSTLTDVVTAVVREQCKRGLWPASVRFDGRRPTPHDPTFSRFGTCLDDRGEPMPLVVNVHGWADHEGTDVETLFRDLALAHAVADTASTLTVMLPGRLDAHTHPRYLRAQEG